MKKSLFIAAALLTLAACTREMDVNTPVGNVTITARTETAPETKTVVEGETHVYWEPGDEIKVFTGGKSGKFTTDITSSAATAEFKGTLSVSEGADIWAVYPYSEDAVYSDGTITTVLPAQQVARAGSFGKDMNLAIAHSTTSDLQFYNVGGGVRFTLWQDGITEVVLEGLKGEILAGKVKVSFQDGKPAIQEVTEGKTAITITPPDGEAFKKNAWYYIVAIPGALEDGFTFHFRKEGTQFTRVFDKTVSVQRSVFGTLPLADLEPGVSYPIPDPIDLGLSVKWASFNLGASKSEEYGEFYAWGEIEPYYLPGHGPQQTGYPVFKPGKEEGYDWPSYRWCKGSQTSFTKYCTNPEYGWEGFTDGKTVLDLEDDAAHVALGGKWRMPTKEEYLELLDWEKCSPEFITENGIVGCKITGRETENSVFLPYAGELNFQGGAEGLGEYWSSSLNENITYRAWNLYLEPGAEGMYSSDLFMYYSDRCNGFPIRPVYGDPPIMTESLSLDKTEIELLIDYSTTLTATIMPENATFRSIVWESSDESVAYVSPTGVVTGLDEGISVITAKSKYEEKTATCIVTVKGSAPAPEAIDLGLPSGIKWASFNLGAIKPEEYGDFYAWGEIEPYYEPGYSQSETPVWKPGKESGYDWPSYRWCKGSSTTLTKYCTSSSYGYNGFTDGKKVLEGQDDAARIVFGGRWRMPTYDEIIELSTSCTWEELSMNGVKGRRVTGPNGNSIFLPATGYRNQGSDYEFEGYYAYYWSSSLCPEWDDSIAWCLGFDSSGVGRRVGTRCDGMPIRPVLD